MAAGNRCFQVFNPQICKESYYFFACIIIGQDSNLSKQLETDFFRYLMIPAMDDSKEDKKGFKVPIMNSELYGSLFQKRGAFFPVPQKKFLKHGRSQCQVFCRYLYVVTLFFRVLTDDRLSCIGLRCIFMGLTRIITERDISTSIPSRSGLR